MAKTTVVKRLLIWTVESEPCGTDADKDSGKAKYYEKPTWYYIQDDVLHCFGYAPGFVRALWNYVRHIPATIALRRWYRQDDRG